MRWLIASFLIGCSLSLPVQAFKLGQTANQVIQRYGEPTSRQKDAVFTIFTYVRPFGQVIVLLGPDQKTEAVLQVDPNYGKEYPQLGIFLSQQTPALSLTDPQKAYSVELYQQLSPQGFEAWLYKKQLNGQVLVFGDLLALPYRRETAGLFLIEYGRRILQDPQIQLLLAPAMNTAPLK